MPAGIVRRIDELGRIVIPKELRRILHIKEGDEMEIVALNEGVMLKKYNGFESVAGVARTASQRLSQLVGADVLFVSTDAVILADGKNKRLYAGEKLSEQFGALVAERKSGLFEGEIVKRMFKTKENKRDLAYVESVVVNGDLVGAMIVLTDKALDEVGMNYMRICIDLISATLA